MSQFIKTNTYHFSLLKMVLDRA